MSEPDPDPFEGYDSPAIMAFVHLHHGERGLRDLLGELNPDRESLWRDAQELIDAGLPHVAEIVLAVAADTPEKACPFPEGTANWRDWNRRHRGIFKGYLNIEDTEGALSGED